MYGPYYSILYDCVLYSVRTIYRTITKHTKNIYKNVATLSYFSKYINYLKNRHMYRKEPFLKVFLVVYLPTLRRVGGGRPKNSHKKEGGGHFLFPPSLRLCFFVWGSSYRSLIIVWCARVKMPAIYSHLPPPLTPAFISSFSISE